MCGAVISATCTRAVMAQQGSDDVRKRLARHRTWLHATPYLYDALVDVPLDRGAITLEWLPGWLPSSVIEGPSGFVRVPFVLGTVEADLAPMLYVCTVR